MTSPETDPTAEFAKEAGVVPREGEPRAEFLRRFGEAATAELTPDPTDYSPDERRKMVDRLYSPRDYTSSDDKAIERLFGNESAIRLLAAKETMQLVRDDFLMTAKQYVCSIDSRDTQLAAARRRGRLQSLQRLAGVASYPPSLDDRHSLTRLDLRELGILQDKITEQDVRVGPFVAIYSHLHSSPDTYMDYAPARLVVDSALEKAARSRGYTRGGAESRGYRQPVQSALVVDFTRAMLGLRAK